MEMLCQLSYIGSFNNLTRSLRLCLSFSIVIKRLRGRAVVARRAHNPEVVGSNPTPATSVYFLLVIVGVAQLAERGTHKPEVVGSIPTPDIGGHSSIG